MATAATSTATATATATASFMAAGECRSSNDSHNNNNKHSHNNNYGRMKRGYGDQDITCGRRYELEFYMDLIERSLQVQLLDNSLWIAERCAAEFPSSPKAVYQLALCHYRCGNYKAARHALQQRIYTTLARRGGGGGSSGGHSRASTATTTATGKDMEEGKHINGDSGEEDNTNLEEDSNNMDYLEALCCYEMKDYSRAEECLLRKARAKFKEQQQQHNNGKNGTSTSTFQTSSFASLDIWIFQTLADTTLPSSSSTLSSSSTSSSSELLPKGAVGFCLLGKIFRRSNRKQRAIQFFKASLRLDPFLWTSMEALAELGAYSTNTTATTVLGPTTRPSTTTACTDEHSELDEQDNENHAPEKDEHDHDHHENYDDHALPPFQLSRKSMDSRGGILDGGAASASSTAARLFGVTPTPASPPMTATIHRADGGDHGPLPPFPSTLRRGGGGAAGTTRHATGHTSALMQTPGLTPIAPTSVSRVMGVCPEEPETPSLPMSLVRPSSTAPTTESASFSFLAPRQTHNATTTTAMSQDVQMLNLPQAETPSPMGGMTVPSQPPATTTRNRPTARFQSPVDHHHHDDDGDQDPIDSMDGENDTSNIRTMFSLPSSDLPRRIHNTTTSTEEEDPDDDDEHNNNNGGKEDFEEEEILQSTRAVKTVLQKKRKPNLSSAATVTGVVEDDNVVHGPTATNLSSAASETVLGLIQTAATFYQHVCQYRCKEALQTMRQFSKRQQDTGWVLHQQGRAHLELNEFTASQRCLELMQAKDPCRLHGLELLSTVYWHLKKEVELSHLSQRVLAANRLSPVTWCVVGNCFSLQKDHESALVFFRRSLQIDPNFTYIHTLCGYEYMANEDFDKAIVCFRQALRVNERHYNAWYGLGAIFHRQEKYDLAEYHFERAMQLHPTSSILLCNLGIAQYANGKAYQALDTLAQAFALDPQNPQARFQRASIYAALHRPAEALAELRKVRDSAPREAAVHFAMGKVLKRLGRPQEAISSFLTAMDLDPKDNQIIKSAMDKVGEPDVGEESMSTF